MTADIFGQRVQGRIRAVFDRPLKHRPEQRRELRQHLGEVFRKLAMQKESRVEEGHLMPDHVHMMISIPPKYAVSQVIGFIGKGNPKDRYSRMLLKKSFGVTNEK